MRYSRREYRNLKQSTSKTVIGVELLYCHVHRHQYKGYVDPRTGTGRCPLCRDDARAYDQAATQLHDTARSEGRDPRSVPGEAILVLAEQIAGRQLPGYRRG